MRNPLLFLCALLVSAASARAQESERYELIPFVPWAAVGPVATLREPVGPAVRAPAVRGSAALEDLRKKAKREPGFAARTLATRQELESFESTHLLAMTIALQSKPASDDLALAERLLDETRLLAEDSGMRRLLETRALSLAAPVEGGAESVRRARDGLRASLRLDVASDLTARVRVAELLFDRARASQKASDPSGDAVPTAEMELRDAWLQLARFQVRHGYLDEARSSLDTVSKGEPGPLAAEEIRRLRERIAERIPQRERLEKALRDVDALPTDAGRWSELSFVLLAHVADEELGTLAAKRSNHPGLVAYGKAGLLGPGRAEQAQAEKLAELVALAPERHQKALAALALRRLTERIAVSIGTDADRLRALREKVETGIAKPPAASGPLAVEVKIPAREAWVATGAFLRRGMRYRVKAEGKWVLVGPGSSRREVDASGVAAQVVQAWKLPAGSLAAQIGASEKMIAVGKDAGFVAHEDGELFLTCVDEFREFSDNEGELSVRIEMPATGQGPRPKRPGEIVGVWRGAGQGKKAARNERDLKADGTCASGAIGGTWVPRGDREAVLRFGNGALEVMHVTAQGDRANVEGNGGKSLSFKKVAANEPQQ